MPALPSLLSGARKILERFGSFALAGTGPAAKPPEKGDRREAVKILTDEIAIGYRPMLPVGGFWDGSADLPNLQQMLQDVESMLAHPRVSICLEYYKAGVADLKFAKEEKDENGQPVRLIAGSSPEVEDFALAELTEWWSNGREKAQRAYEYGRGGAEIVYKAEGGYLKYGGTRDFFPLDCTVLTRKKEYAGIRVRAQERGSTDLWGPSWCPAKGFWFAHNTRYSRYYGLPQVYPAWRPWRRLAGRDGGEETIDGAVYRFAYCGPIGRYPMEDIPTKPTGFAGYSANQQPITNRDKMREFVENAKAGVSIAMSSRRDESGNYVWDLDWPEHTIEVDGLLRYADSLEKQISLGIGIAPELLEASETGSGYSGRAIPLEVFYIRQQAIAENLVRAWLAQIGMPLIKWNFGPEAWVKIKVPSILAQKLKARQQGDQGPQKPPEQPGRQGQGDFWENYQGNGDGNRAAENPHDGDGASGAGMFGTDSEPNRGETVPGTNAGSFAPKGGGRKKRAAKKPEAKHGEAAARVNALRRQFVEARKAAVEEIGSARKEARKAHLKAAKGIRDAFGQVAFTEEEGFDSECTDLEDWIRSSDLEDSDFTASDIYNNLEEVQTQAEKMLEILSRIKSHPADEEEGIDEVTEEEIADNKKHLTTIQAKAREARRHLKEYRDAGRALRAIKTGEDLTRTGTYLNQFRTGRILVRFDTAGQWVHDPGPRSQKRWKNTRTGEVVYSDNPPRAGRRLKKKRLRDRASSGFCLR